MSDHGSIDNWRRDHDNDPRNYSDIASPEFAQAAPLSSQHAQSQQGRRKSILVDPEERARRPRAARQNSQVRLRSSDDEGDAFEPLRKPPTGAEGSRLARNMASKHDLERKNGAEHRRFREKRDGYESDEGDTLRRGESYTTEASRPRPRQQRTRDADDDDDDYRRGGGRGGGDGGGSVRSGGGRSRRDPRDLDRGDPRDIDPRDVEPRDRRDPRDMPIRSRPPPVQYGDAPLPSRGRGGGDSHDYRDDPPPRDMYRSNTAREPRRRPARGYDDSDNDDYRAPMRRRETARDGDRSGRYDPRDDYDAGRRDGGYKSDRDGQRRNGPRYDDYYSDGDHARGSNRNPRYYEDDRRYGRRDSYGRRDPHDDRRDRDRDRDRGGRGDRYRDDYRDGDRRDRDKKDKKGNDLQTAAQAAFATYAMPMIKKEGGKFLRKQLQQYMGAAGK